MLRTHKLGEADRIVVLLTREHGQVRSVAKGVRRTSSRFGSRLEPFGVIDVLLHEGRTFDVVTQVETITAHGPDLAADWELFTRATVMVETAERLTADEAEGAHAQYLLLVGALNALARRRHDPVLVLASYLLRALAIAGWAPSCFDCAVCGAAGPHRAFSVPEGGAVCDDCRPEGALSPSPGAMALLGDLLSGDWARADVSEGYCRSEVTGMVTAYTQWHLERRLRSLQVLERSR